MNRITLIRPDDWHLHLRFGELQRLVTKYTANVFGRALIMGNVPFVPDADAAVDYYQEIMATMVYYREVMGICQQPFQPFMTIFLSDDTTPEMVREAHKVGVRAAKLMPKGHGASTGGANGVSNIPAMYRNFAAMEELGMRLCIHGEDLNEPDEALREVKFGPILFDIVASFQALKIALEHLSTAEACDWVTDLTQVHGSITPQHLLLTRDDVYNPFRPHNRCKPVAKTEWDRFSLRQLATSGSPKVYAGTDSAPHPLDKKTDNPETCAAGVWSAPVAMPVYAQVFEEEGRLHNLEDFTSRNGAAFWGMEPNPDTITMELVDGGWTVPDQLDGLVPFLAGETLRWRVLADVEG